MLPHSVQVQQRNNVAATLCKQIADANSDTMERWGDLPLDARSIEDVFGPGTSDVH